MDKDRNLGVTEARFALTILTCLLVAIGYIALLRLGGTKDPTADQSTEEISPPIIAGPETPPAKTELPPIVLRLEPNEPASLAKRPPSGQQPLEPERR
jgi:hypothetical protein